MSAWPGASLTSARGHLVLEHRPFFLFFFFEPNARDPLPYSFLIKKKKKVAVTPVSGSDDIFSSLSSNGGEKAVR